jgi:predicted RNase H-like HicB family nuclease
MRIADYRVKVEALTPEDGGGFLAWVPDLPGCSSDGETIAEAVQNVQQAIKEWIEEAERLGAPIPLPSRQTAAV